MLWDKGHKPYSPTEKELARMKRFREKHCRKHAEHGTAIGFAITLMPSGIGVGVAVKCIVCKKKKDVTDYDSW